MACSIDNIRFGSSSKNAIEEIKELQGLANSLSVFIGASALLDIFAGNGVYMTSYKIQTTDFVLLAQAMKTSNLLLKNQVERISGTLYMNASISPKEKLFWKCLYNEIR